MLNKIRNAMLAFRKCESGATIVEYAVALIIVVGVGTIIVTNLGDNVADRFSDANDCLDPTSTTC